MAASVVACFCRDGSPRQPPSVFVGIGHPAKISLEGEWERERESEEKAWRRCGVD